jgi:hypothetical protein
VSFKTTQRSLLAILAIVLALAAFAACGRRVGEASNGEVVDAARDHTIATLITGDTAYRSRMLVIERQAGPDLRVGADGTTGFELHVETMYARLSGAEQATVSTWREYLEEPDVRYPVGDCDLTWVTDQRGTFERACDGTWAVGEPRVLRSDVKLELRTTVDLDALTRVDDEVHRGMPVAVYEGFNLLRGQLRHITFMVGLGDGIVRHARTTASTITTEWEHFSMGSPDIVVSVPENPQ